MATYPNGTADYPRWWREDFLRRDSGDWKSQYLQEWTPSPNVYRVLDSRPSGPMDAPVNTTKVLFVGGPWDGQRRDMDHTPSRFYVEVLTKVSDDVDMETGEAKPGPVEASKVAYAKVEFGNVTFYKSLPSKDWRKYPTHELAAELFKGYQNLA